MIKIKKGLDLPITGNPEQKISAGATVTQVAVLGPDYIGMRPTMLVQEGDRVKKGQVVFTDKKTPGVQYTAPAAGVVKAINRGVRRAFLSLVIDVDGDEEERFQQYDAAQLSTLSRADIQANLVASGLWTALRTRPYSQVPALDGVAQAIFVNAMDTNPLAANPEVVIAEQPEAFKQGLVLLSKLTQGKLYLCKAPNADIPQAGVETVEEFAGPHPAGLSGTHIHFLHPVNESRTVWTIGYQDVIAIGTLFTTGTLDNQRVVALAGPSAVQPRLVRTQLGANLVQLCENEQQSGDNRIVSGSVFGGRTATDELQYLGRYHQQVTLLSEGRERHLLHYLTLGKNRFSVMPIYLSKLFPKKFGFTTSTMGSERAMVPIGAYEKIMPLDILPTQLLRSLIVLDTDTAAGLGALELDEEDLALCTFVCPGKYEYGPILRKNLTQIQAEG